MLRRLSRFLLGLSTIWTLALATATYGLFLVAVMPQQSAATRSYAGEWGAPDGHLTYSPEAFHAAVATWGEAGRRDYSEFRLGLDIVWAVAYTSFLVLAIGCAVRGAFGPDDRRRLLNLLPLVTMLLDYAENAAGIFLVSEFPARHAALARLAALLTTGKWLTLAAAHVALGYAAVLAIRARWRRPAVRHP